MTDSFAGTRLQDIVDGLETVYAGIETAQDEWKAVSPFQCPSGCGSCCVDFEPDVLECEALYLAAWLLEHQREKAESLAQGTFQSPRTDPERGCVFFDPDTPYHCTVYGGRALICRLFGYTGDRGKDGQIRWKPCKFLPLEGRDHGENRRAQYSAGELQERFGAAPPAMSDITAQALALSPDSTGQRLLLREALPLAIARIQMAIRFAAPPEPNEPNPENPNPLSPQPLAS